MSDATPEFKPGGGVPDGPVYVDRRDIEPVITADEAEALRTVGDGLDRLFRRLGPPTDHTEK